MRPIIFIFIVLILFSACTKQLDADTQLRVYNINNIHFDSVIVNAPGGKQVYYNIPPLSLSEYKSFTFLYNYSYIEVHFNNQVVKLQPFDYVGEEKLKPGKYRYELGIVAAQQNSLTLECKKD
ncbi:hypothetical protein [Lacibacter sp. H407]|uniref:hypothetical protein n=1 Tax=Lacibacter sp. H407 TaxID=3133423 RepID=UPI0030BBDD99